MRSLSEKSVESAIKNILMNHKNELRGHRVVLFGSRARGSADKHSDFDLGVDGDTPLDLSVFFDIQDEFERLPTLYRIDWVDLCRAPRKIRHNARREGTVFYES